MFEPIDRHAAPKGRGAGIIRIRSLVMSHGYARACPEEPRSLIGCLCPREVGNLLSVPDGRSFGVSSLIIGHGYACARAQGPRCKAYVV